MDEDKLVVMLDPGHGGDKDRGAVHPPAVESMINLAVARRLGGLLNSEGFVVLTTRAYDTPVSLDRRVDLCQLFLSDLYLSLHANSCSSPGPRGLEVFTSPGRTDADPIAEHLCQALMHSFPASRFRSDYSDGDADKEANFQVLTQTPSPAVLIEMGFLSNPQERAWLLDETTQTHIALAICSGLLTWRLER